MNQAIESIWEAIGKAQEIYAENNEISFDITDAKKNSFSKKFQQTYFDIKKKYMKPDVIALDRHKVAAIIICTIIEEDIVKPTKEIDKNTIFLGSEMIALSVGLSYMQRSLNDILSELSIPKIINGYYMPTAMACQTDYFDIMARNLYFSRKSYVLNPLDLADKLFLIEYLTLESEMIDPKILLKPLNKTEEI